MERHQSADGKHTVRIFSRGPDCFYFVELSETTEKGETFWTATRTSKEHGPLEAVHNTALRQLPWLKEAM